MIYVPMIANIVADPSTLSKNLLKSFAVFVFKVNDLYSSQVSTKWLWYSVGCEI